MVRWLFEGKLGLDPKSGEAIDTDRDSIYFTLIDKGSTLLVLSQSPGPKETQVRIGAKTINVKTVPDEIISVRSSRQYDSRYSSQE